MRMKQKSTVLKTLLLLTLCVCLCLPLCSAADSGVEVDDEGGVWDYDNNTYTDPDGNVYDITPEGVPEEENPNPPVQNPDGSIDVDSGEYPIPQSEDPTRAPIEGDEWQALLDRVAARNGAFTPTVYTDPSTGESVAVEVKYMGIGRSMIVLNGQDTLVNTVDLKWQTEAPEDKVLAVIRAPSHGHAVLHAGKSKKSTVLKQCRTDSVVRVISTGKNWTLVDHQGMRGYVQTAALEFFWNDHTDFDAGYVSIKGRIKGKDTANVRSSDEKCRILDEFRLGTPLTVFDVIEDWAEVDVGGWHCRINVKYVTLEKELASAR